MASSEPRLVSLAHLKRPVEVPMAAPKKVMAWAGGKITTNKEEATIKWLKRKRDKGEELTEEQRKVIAKFSLSSDDTGSSIHEKVEEAEGERVSVPAGSMMKTPKFVFTVGGDIRSIRSDRKGNGKRTKFKSGREGPREAKGKWAKAEFGGRLEKGNTQSAILVAKKPKIDGGLSTARR